MHFLCICLTQGALSVAERLIRKGKRINVIYVVSRQTYHSWNNNLKCVTVLTPAAWRPGRCRCPRKCHTVRCSFRLCNWQKSFWPQLSPQAIANTPGHIILNLKSLLSCHFNKWVATLFWSALSGLIAKVILIPSHSLAQPKSIGTISRWIYSFFRKVLCMNISRQLNKLK